MAAGMVKDLPIAAVPKEVKAAAKKAVPGIRFTGAEIQKKPGGVTIYELDGVAEGKEYEINLSPKGEVLAIRHIAVNDEDG